MANLTSSSCLGRLLNFLLFIGLIMFLAIYFLDEEVPSNSSIAGTIQQNSRDFPDRGYSGSQCPTILYNLSDQHQDALDMDFAEGLIRHHGYFSLDMAADVFDYFNDWRHGPNAIDWTIARTERKGSVTDYCVLLSSSIEALGGSVRIVLIRGQEGSIYCYPEVMVPRGQNVHQAAEILINRYRLNVNFIPAHRVDAEGNVWLNFDRSGGWPGGTYRAQGPGYLIEFPGTLCQIL
jgi:hypothetical protein